jgi:hypothetical protein
MRKAAIAFFVLFVASAASAGTITSVDPSEIVVNSGEYFMTVLGRDLGLNALFSGPAGDFVIEVQGGGGDRVTVWVPTEVIATVGTHTVTILGGPTGDSNGFPFEIVGPPAQPLMVFGPEVITVAASSRDGEVVTFEVAATGGEDPNPVVTCNPPSGSLFRYGTTHVLCEATNSFGERATDGFQVILYDATPPELTLPDNIVVPAEGPDGAVVTWEASANDAIDGPLEVTCNPPSGSRSPIGITTVECTATDLSYNPSTGTFTVEVTGGEPEELVIHVPDTIVAEATGPDGAVVEFTVTADGTSDPNPDISCTPPSGSTFPLGETAVACTATDDFGHTASDSFQVIVVDTVAPVISSVTASPNALSPPNNKLVAVTVEAAASDVVDPMPQCSIVDVTSNQNINGDAHITGPLTVDLRAERDEGTERKYVIHVNCTDASGNAAMETTTVRVPKGSGDQQQVVTTPSPRKAFKKWW